MTPEFNPNQAHIDLAKTAIIAARSGLLTAGNQVQFIPNWRGNLPTVKTPTLFLPTPHAAQEIVLAQARRFNWLAAGRRWRKTSLVMRIAVQAAQTGKQLFWGAPVYDQVRVGWDETKRACTNLISHGLADFNQSRMEVLFPKSGGRITYRSLDNPDNARGHTADGVVIDEAAEVVRSAWHEVLRPMLLDTGGWLWALFTPKGMNWVWEEHAKAAEMSDTVAWQAPTFGAEIVDGSLIRRPHPLENPEIEWAEMESLWTSMPSDSFRQEILAEFVSDAGSVFRNIRKCATATPQERALPGHRYVIGCDWAKERDYSVFTVIDCTTRELVHIDRFNHLEYLFQIDRLVALCERFQPVSVISEETGNLALNELLWRSKYRALDPTIRAGGSVERSLPLRPFKTTNQRKAEAVQALALALEREELKVLNEPALMNELLAFAMERLGSGAIRYAAPEGMHDDLVLSLCFAWFEGRRFSRELQLSTEQKIKALIPDEYKPADPQSLPAEERAVIDQGFYYAYHKAKRKVESQQVAGGVYAQARAKYGRKSR